MSRKVLDRTQTNGLRVGMKVMRVSHTTCCFHPLQDSGDVYKVGHLLSKLETLKCIHCHQLVLVKAGIFTDGYMFALCNWLPLPEESDSQELRYSADKTKEKQT